MQAPNPRVLSGLVGIALLALSTPASAQEFRDIRQIPGAAPFHIDLLKDEGYRIGNQRIVLSDDFGPGASRKFGGTDKAFVGTNTAFVGDFNGDGWDDIGVKWTSGEHDGKWVIAFNDKKGGFLPGQIATIGGSQTAYLGANTPIIGDFNGDGWDDIGVKWTSGEHNGKWVISINQKQANPTFGPGTVATISGKDKEFVGANSPIVGDFDGDGVDDIGVRWTGSGMNGNWHVALNAKTASPSFHMTAPLTFGTDTTALADAQQVVVADFNGDGLPDLGARWNSGTKAGRFEIALNHGAAKFSLPRRVRIGGSDAAYAGDNQALAGRFDGGKHAMIGVRWTGGTNAGLWVFSPAVARDKVTKTPSFEARVPVVFVNFHGATVDQRFTESKAQQFLDSVKRYYQATTHGVVNFSFRHVIIDLPNPVTWTGNAPQPVYNSDGILTNGANFPTNENFTGYWCRFPLQQKADQIVFKDAKGNLDWETNLNIHRNYCQVAERNFARDALQSWLARDTVALRSTMDWAARPGHAPLVAYVGAGMPGGGARAFEKGVGQEWPLKVDKYTFKHYIYQTSGAQILAHELGHFLGLPDLYKRLRSPESYCKGRDATGFLGGYDLMGYQEDFMAGLSAPHRFRLGLAEGRYVVKQHGGAQEVTLEPTMNSQSSGRTLAIVHPDPVGHPGEIWLLENRRRNGDWEAVDHQGLYVYHLRTSGWSTEAPQISLDHGTANCTKGPLKTRTWQNGMIRSYSFHDGKPATFKIKQKKVESNGSITVEVVFD
jgi:M6 family metalloprotease-like protein